MSKERQIECRIQPCLVHWGRFNIDLDGSAVVCFNELFRRELNPEYIFGNIMNESIESIWKSDRMNALRLYLLGKINMECRLPCVTCTTCQKYPPHNYTSERQVTFLNKDGEKVENE